MGVPPQMPKGPKSGVRCAAGGEFSIVFSFPQTDGEALVLYRVTCANFMPLDLFSRAAHIHTLLPYPSHRSLELRLMLQLLQISDWSSIRPHLTYREQILEPALLPFFSEM
jgi:hypothetical protein